MKGKLRCLVFIPLWAKPVREFIQNWNNKFLPTRDYVPCHSGDNKWSYNFVTLHLIGPNFFAFNWAKKYVPNFFSQAMAIWAGFEGHKKHWFVKLSQFFDKVLVWKSKLKPKIEKKSYYEKISVDGHRPIGQDQQCQFWLHQIFALTDPKFFRF